MFDIDSVGLLQLLSDMNAGVEETRAPDGRLLATHFYLGCVVTNHKLHEREVMPQYFKLEKKVRAGARVRGQPGRLERAQGRRAVALGRRAGACR